LSTDAEQHEVFYQATIAAYKKVYDRLGIGEDTYVTFASGGAFTQFSHEFQTICEAGEDVIYVNREKGIAVNEEVLNDETLKTLGVTRDELTELKSAEVGNIFNFGTDKSEQMGIFYTDENDKKVPIFLGSYGIGITRVMGVVVEKFSDDKGIVWPESIAPFKVYLVSIGDVASKADALYDELTSKGIEVLYDDRDERAGAKFADAELLGIPYRVTISERLVADNKLEFTPRKTGESELLTAEDLLAKLS